MGLLWKQLLLTHWSILGLGLVWSIQTHSTTCSSLVCRDTRLDIVRTGTQHGRCKVAHSSNLCVVLVALQGRVSRRWDIHDQRRPSRAGLLQFERPCTYQSPSTDSGTRTSLCCARLPILQQLQSAKKLFIPKQRCACIREGAKNHSLL